MTARRCRTVTAATPRVSIRSLTATRPPQSCHSTLESRHNDDLTLTEAPIGEMTLVARGNRHNSNSVDDENPRRSRLVTSVTAISRYPPASGHELAVSRVFDYYLEQTDRSPKLYTLTSGRKDVGIARLEDCLKKTDGDVASAEELMRICIENLAASDFHMGKNDRNREYTDWIDHLFKTT